MYLYTAKADGLEKVPEALAAIIGHTHLALSMLLTEQKKLHRASALDVICAIEAKGFYLQLPPAEDKEMAAMANKNSKLQH